MRMAVVNVLKRLGRGDVDIEYVTEKLNRIDAQVQRAARVVDHMRVFGRRSEVEEQLFDPAQAVEGTISMLAEGMKGKGVQLRVGTMIEDVQVRGHVDQLEQVLINLMVNARDALLSRREKDRDFEPWISVEAERDENIIRLAVQDNGGGLIRVCWSAFSSRSSPPSLSVSAPDWACLSATASSTRWAASSASATSGRALVSRSSCRYSTPVR